MMKDFLNMLSWQECLGFIFSVCQVVLARYNNPKNYLFGIAGIILSLFVMYNAKLYAEFTLSIYYLVMSIYGWLYWKFGKQKDEIEISETNSKEWKIVAAIVIISFFIFYFALTHFTDSDVPIWDSLVSAFAWAGMWLMAKRKLENWILLNISNIISIPLMVHKGLYLYAILSFILFSVAISGYMNWRTILKEKNA
ncbi:nicotinamide riboside transporter PnuC [Chishuiella changwenlii]|uniref:nicotinamide riboside transporter PnuC n=1 Tax=Chishuiella changwenlii TaxID=1434701 RepID=UPI002FDAA94E